MQSNSPTPLKDTTTIIKYYQKFPYHMKNVCVIGLGYVGLPLAELCLKKGYKVSGLEVDSAKVERISKSHPGIILNEPNSVANSDIAIICVPTPVDNNKMPDLSCVISATNEVARGLHKGMLVIMESTVNPCVTDEDVQPILESTGLKAGIDFNLAHCPERINPGDPHWHVGNIPRVIGATTKEGCKRAKEFYESILNAPIKEMSSIKAAEAVKIVENSFRDVNIAFVNELAKSFTKFGIDITEVIEGAKTKPFGFMAHYPGCGVGGHCISVDPYYLIEKAKLLGFDHKLLKLAREINSGMPHYTVELVVNALNETGKSLKGSKIGILGLTYKPGVEDLRESPALEVVEELKKRKAEILAYEPYIPSMSNATAEEAINNTDVVVLLTAHPEFKALDYSKAKIIVDGRNFLDKTSLSKHSRYSGIGR